MPRAELYAQQMMSLDMGYALFLADPCGEYDTVMPGQVGEVTGGKFYPSTNWRMWEADKMPYLRRHREEAQKPLRTKTVTETTLDVNLNVASSPLGLNVGYHCNGFRGAILALKDQHAWSWDLPMPSEEDFMRYAIRNYRNVVQDIRVPLKDLFFITGTTMTGDWDAILIESDTRAGDLSLGADVESIVTVKSSIAVRRSSGQVIHQSSGHHHEPGHPQTETTCCSQPKNQCIFVRAFHLRSRTMRVPKVIKAAASPKDLDKDDADGDYFLQSCSVHSEGSEEPSTSDPEVEAYRVAMRPPDNVCISVLRAWQYHSDKLFKECSIYDEIFDYIFDRCTGDIALVHDRDVALWSKLQDPTRFEITSHLDVPSASNLQEPLPLVGRIMLREVTLTFCDLSLPLYLPLLDIKRGTLATGTANHDSAMLYYSKYCELMDQLRLKDEEIHRKNEEIRSKDLLIEQLMEQVEVRSTTLVPPSLSAELKRREILGWIKDLKLDLLRSRDSENASVTLDGTATPDSAAGSRKRSKIPIIAEEEVEEDEEELPAKRPSRACQRCKGLKVRCDFPPDADACKKCMQSGSECFIPGRKKRRPPAKRDVYMRQIRLKDSLIEQLLEQLEARFSVLAPLSLGGAPVSSLHNQQLGNSTDLTSSAALQAAEEKRERELAEWIKRAKATIMQTRESSNLLGGDANPLLGQDEPDDDWDDEEYHSHKEENGGGVAVEAPNGQVVDPSLHNINGEDRGDPHDSLVSVSRHHASRSHRTSKGGHEVQGSALPSVAPLGFLENMGKKLRRRRSSGSSGSGGEEEKLGVANPFFFTQSIKPSIVVDEDQFQLPQILTKGIVTPNDVADLFNTYFECMNLSTCLLDDLLYTPEKTLYRSPFLFTVICAIASRYHPGRKDLYPILMNHARLAAGTALISGRKSLEVCQAYILMAQYPIPARRWSEDRSWMFLGCAIRMATDLNLHHPPVLKSGRTATTIDTIMEQEGQAREILNRTRAWLACFNIDKATSTQFGKPTTLREDWMFPLLQRNMAEGGEGGAEWWGPSPFAAKFDIHLCAHSALLREIAEFHEKIYSDPTNPNGVNETIDFEQVTYDFDDKIEHLGEQWFLRVDTHMDRQDPQCIFRKGLLKLEFYYNQLVALSFGFQHAFRRGAVQKDNQFLLRCHAAASRVVSIVVDELAPQKYMRYCPESHFIFATFASAFLLKLLRPKFSAHLETHQQNDILHLVDRLVKTLSEVAMDDRHAPKLYSRFIVGLLKKAHEILVRGTASVSSVSSMSSPESVGDPSPAGSGDTLTPGGSQALGDPANPSSYNMEGVQNALPVNVWSYGFGDNGENNDTLASMQFFDDNQFWEDGLLPGFSWTGPGPTTAGDDIIADAAFLEQEAQI